MCAPASVRRPAARVAEQLDERAYARADALRVQIERVEQDRAHADGVRRERIVRVRVADEGSLARLDAEPFEREPEDGCVGLAAADELRVNQKVEAPHSSRRLKR